MIDLRSDTVTGPTAAMRQAMAAADVGDDVYRDDPTVLALERRTAEILGKDDAVYMPTGTMTNQVAIRTHTEPGDQILIDVNAHVARPEAGGPAALSGVMTKGLPGVHGVFTADDVHAAATPVHPFTPATLLPPTRLLCIENTHNGGGGTIWPLERITDVCDAARQHGLRLHMDGARLWHASVAMGISEREYAAPFDTVSVCFSKGLGAPVGSALAGSSELVARARRFKAMFGGGFRQAGVVAAGALHALEHHRAGLAADHSKATAFAEGLSRIPGIEIDLARVQTNIVRFSLAAMPSGTFVERCHAAGLHLLTAGADGVRAVPHADISEAQIAEALAIAGAVMSEQAA
ncbi:MAG: GntG family PLP-dependent aldolase [Vicinamibacterales bacterium]|jgi:threonine aldolase|nr:GntG family PLP-dependent aldolase [Vicinamibacterales bacterium]